MKTKLEACLRPETAKTVKELAEQEQRTDASCYGGTGKGALSGGEACRGCGRVLADGRHGSPSPSDGTKHGGNNDEILRVDLLRSMNCWCLHHGTNAQGAQGRAPTLETSPPGVQPLLTVCQGQVAQSLAVAEEQIKGIVARLTSAK
jgi:hypothetical protein